MNCVVGCCVLCVVCCVDVLLLFDVLCDVRCGWVVHVVVVVLCCADIQSRRGHQCESHSPVVHPRLF